MNFGEAD